MILWGAAGAFFFLTTHGLAEVAPRLEVVVGVLAVALSPVLDKLDEKVVGLWVHR